MSSREIEGAGGCDPDIEARLYGEIHYSNETYPDRTESSRNNNNDEFINLPRNPMLHMASRYSSVLPQYNPHAYPYEAHHNQWSIDTRPTRSTNNPTMYLDSRQITRPTSNYHFPQHQSNYQTNREMYSKRPRSLLDGHMYPPIPPLLYDYPSTSMPPPSTQRYDNYSRNVNYDNRYSARNTFSSNNSQPRFSTNQERSSRRIPRTTNIPSKKKRAVQSRNKLSLPPVTAKKPLKKNNTNDIVTNDDNPNESENSQVITDETDKNTVSNSNSVIENSCPVLDNNDSSTSKYDVMAKTNQQPEINPSEEVTKNSVDASSDSDESILEVPVPPKPAPLLINLQDSEDELSSDDDDDEQSPVIMGQSLSQELPQPTQPPSTDEVEKSSKQPTIPTIIPTSTETTQPTPESVVNETLKDTADDDFTNDIDITTSNIVINCTQVATGITTLADIRQMRDSVNATINNNSVSDDDSMTESEAMKWRQIEGETAGNKSDKGTDGMWSQLTENTTESVEKTVDKTIVLDDDDDDDDDNLTVKLSKPANNVCDEASGSKRKSSNEVNSRKRARLSESESEHGDKQNDTNVDENVKKRKSTREMSFEEYIFQPMPKQLTAFYNEPRGGMMMTMDVHKIQSRMPNNPNRWTILDIDKYNGMRSYEKRSVCGVCQGEGHKRDRCPTMNKRPTCRMCGENGHRESRCPQSMCLTCGTKFTSYRKTCDRCRGLQCSTCKSWGHTRHNCPDLWRRYHQTTPPNSDANSPREKGTHKSSSSKHKRHKKSKDRSHTKSPPKKSSKNSKSKSSSTSKKKSTDKFESKSIHPSSSSSSKHRHTVSNREKNSHDKTKGKDSKTSSASESKNAKSKSSKSPKISNNENKSNEPSPTTASPPTPLPLNGHIFFHWKSSNLWPTTLTSNYTKLNDIEGSIIDGLIAGTVFPAFITELDDICPFELIMGYHNGYAQMFLETYNDEVLKLLEKLLVMWLTREDDEKWLMIGSATLPINRRNLLDTLKERQVIARCKWSTADQENMRDIMYQMEERQQIIDDIYKTYPTVRPTNIQSSLEKVQTAIYDLKWRIVLCLYYCDWIEGGTAIIDHFHTMLMELERNTIYIDVPAVMYLKLLIFSNEVFTPHMSRHIIDGAKRCIDTINKKQEYERKVRTAFTKNKMIMRTLCKLMFEYEDCKQYKTMSNRELLRRFGKVEGILIECPENEKYIKSLEGYRELFIDDGSIQQLTVIVGYFSSLLRKKLQLSDVWRKTKVQKIRQDLEEKRHLNKLSELNKKTVATGSVDTSSDSDIVEVPVEKKKIEELTISDNENENVNRITIDNNGNDDDDDDYDDSEFIRALKEIMKESTPASNVDSKTVNCTPELPTNTDDNNEEAILLDSLKMLEELMDDPELQ